MIILFFHKIVNKKRMFFNIPSFYDLLSEGLFLLSGILFVNPTDSLAASKSAEVQTRSSYWGQLHRKHSFRLKIEEQILQSGGVV